jgi:shikimate kinase
MTRVLITGMSGTGKSTVIERLAALGYTAVDTDSDEWCEWREMSLDGGPAAWDWVWREDRMRILLETSVSDFLFVAGCKSNQGVFYDHFDHVVLLSAPIDVMLDRVTLRTTNAFGKLPEEREKILRDTSDVVPLLRASADIEINTATASVKEVVAAIVALANTD